MKKPNYSNLITGFFTLKGLNDYIISKIRIEAFLDIRFRGNNIVFSVSAISGTKIAMRYNFDFNMNQCFLEDGIDEHYFFEHVDRYILETNDHFRADYLK